MGIEMYDDQVECLWVRIQGKATKADILLGVCFHPHNQGGEVDNFFYKQLENVSASSALVLVGDFKLPDICWELNTAEKRQSRKFLECVEENFLLSCADSRVSPARKAQVGLKERYRVGSLLGRGGFGSVWAATRLSDGAPVAIKRVPRNRVRHWGELPDGTSAPLEIVLLDKVSTGFPGVIQLLEWLELPNNIVMVLERPERCQDLHHFIRARGLLSEEVARELFRQVLEAVRHCTSCGVLHRDIKPQNVLVDLATGQAKLIDFSCGTYLQDTAYTHFAGTLSCSPPEWTKFGWYYGKPATIWSLGILLHQMVCGEHPFRRGQNISWDHQLSLPQRLSQECQGLIRRCLSMLDTERPSLEDLISDPWMQNVHQP
ncbi:serine/threonine-protein kinase pim-1-like [Acridotheres tristis]